MAKVKKTAEEKMVAQIDALISKQYDANLETEKLMRQNAAISHQPDAESRKQHRDTEALMNKISLCIQRRARLLKRKGDKLAELQTMSLGVTP